MNYDKEKLQIGYKGSFVIHDHKAKTRHWDLRLEFPVDKEKTVLRSWAIPKHKVPEKEPILATETEDHDISYKNFKGKIPEGKYGAGSVDIYDKGNFSIVDLDYDKKYVIKFNGEKIKGYYALIKIDSKKFLWIKVKNISDYKKSFSERIVSDLMYSEKTNLNPLRERLDYC